MISNEVKIKRHCYPGKCQTVKSRSLRLFLECVVVLLLAITLMAVTSSPARAACSSPAGGAGEILYNTDKAVMQWCDGAQWIGFPVPDGTIINSFASAGSSPRGLAWDGTNLWETESSIIYKLDPSDGTVISSFGAPDGVSGGLTWDGTNLWNTQGTNDTIYKLDPSDGSVLDSFSAPGPSPQGLTWDGTNLWNVDLSTDTIYKLNPSNGNVISSFASPSSNSRGLAWDGTYLWSADYGTDTIYKLDPSDGSIVSFFASPSSNPYGLTWDGANLWSADISSGTIYKLEVPTTGPSCTNSPSGTAGEILYNSDNAVLQWCDGTQWIGLPKPQTFTAVSAGRGNNQGGFRRGYGCGIKADGTAWCWGYGGYYLGNGGTSSHSLPVQVSDAGPWDSISASYDHTCGIKSDGTAWCWGTGYEGKLGDGTATASPVPVQVSNAGPWQSISAGEDHTCGVKTDNTAWCWGGYDGYGCNCNSGQIGDGGAVQRDNPVQISEAGPWDSISAGTRSSCAIKTDGTAWCWGLGTSGQLGDGTSSSQTTPVQVKDSAGTGTWSDWTAISTGGGYSCGVRSDGTAWCWGSNSAGQLGDGTTTDSSLPVQVSNAGPWQSISTGRYSYTNGYRFTCGIKTSGTAWCWGGGSTGSPSQVSGGGTWQTVSVAGHHNCGIRDGSAWCWRYEGDGGALGNGSTGAYRGTPVPVGGGSSSGTGCSSPSGTAGMIVYNTDNAVMQWCDGTQWIGFKKPPIDKTVFVTSTTYDGNLGGASGADSLCQARADAVGSLAPAGTYKAWISYTTAPDFPRTGPLNETLIYKLTTGTVIATGWDDLTDGTLAAAINRDEFGSTQTGNVWSNTDSAGLVVDFTVSCSDWSTNSGGSNRGRAGSSSSNTATWADTTNPQCNNLLRLYCFEQ